MRLLQQLTIFLLPMTALNPGFNLTLGDVCLFLVIGLAWQRSSIHHHLLLAFVVITAFAATLAMICNSMLGPSTGRWLDTAQALLLFWIILPRGWSVAGELEFAQVARPLALSGCVQGVVALLQIPWPWLRIPGQATYGLGEFGLRPLGLADNPNGLALMLLWSIASCLWLALAGRTRGGQVGWTLAAIVCSAGAIATFSKTALAGVPVAVAATLVLGHGRRRPVLAVLGITVLVFFLAFGGIWSWLAEVVHYRFSTTASFADRFRSVGLAWRALHEWWLFGVGAGADTLYGENGINIHNQVFGLSVQFGIPVMLLIGAQKLLLCCEGLGGDRRLGSGLLVAIFVLNESLLQVHPVYWMRGYYLPYMILMAFVLRTSAPPASSHCSTPAAR